MFRLATVLRVALGVLAPPRTVRALDRPEPVSSLAPGRQPFSRVALVAVTELGASGCTRLPLVGD